MTLNSNNCPACSCTESRDYRADKFHGNVRECCRCNAVYTPVGCRIYLGESYGIVEPWFTTDPSADERARYFDLDCLGSKGLSRRHGWFDPETGLVTQIG